MLGNNSKYGSGMKCLNIIEMRVYFSKRGGWECQLRCYCLYLELIGVRLHWFSFIYLCRWMRRVNGSFCNLQSTFRWLFHRSLHVWRSRCRKLAPGWNYLRLFAQNSIAMYRFNSVASNWNAIDCFYLPRPAIEGCSAEIFAIPLTFTKPMRPLRV